MSSSNATLYYTAMEDMFKDLLLDSDGEKQVDTAENEVPLMDTPKRMVRLRQHTLFAKETKDFFISRRLPISPSRKDQDLLRLRRERCEVKEKKPMPRLTMRI